MDHRLAPQRRRRKGRRAMIVYLIVRWLGRLYLRLLRGLEVRNADLVPVEGPLIVCANHVDWVDPVVVGCGTARVVSFMAKRELFHSPVAGWFLKQLQAFPVRRGEVDRAALRASVKVLECHGALGLFPEGTRSRTGRLQPPEPGAALIALRTGATIVPAGITGSRGGGRVILTWGQPFTAGEVVGGLDIHNHEAVGMVSGEIMRRIAALIGQEPPPARQGRHLRQGAGGAPA